MTQDIWGKSLKWKWDIRVDKEKTKYLGEIETLKGVGHTLRNILREKDDYCYV